jgi:hypothetical protein
MRQKANHSTILVALRQSGPMFLAGLVVCFLVAIASWPASLEAASKVTSILLNDEADADGVVEKHKDQFSPTTAEIYGTGKITGAEKGQKVTADLLYGPENIKPLTITKEVSGSGDITFTFAFSKPTNDWPAGDYKVVISTSDGATKQVPFQVR